MIAIMFILTVCIVGVAVAGVIYLRQIYSAFSKYGVKHITPLPLVGNMGKQCLGLEHFADHITGLYKKFPEERFVGRFEFVNELVVLRDLDLIKQVFTKDMECFDHRSPFSESDSFFGRNLFALNGQEWKKMRATLSPAFTGSKIRKMVPFIMEVGDQMTAMLMKKMKESKTGYINIDCEELTSSYANDVIVSCALGLKVDSYKDPENPIYARGRESATFGFREVFMYFLISNLPSLAKIFEWDILSQSCKEFFRNIVLDVIKDRELKQTVRPDMIHLLMEAKKGKLSENTVKSDEANTESAKFEQSAIATRRTEYVLTDDDIIAQILLLYLEGFGTVSILMNFLLYELAANSDIQDRLAKEIKEHHALNVGKLDYDSLKSMPYLDMVISEVIRLWHPSIILDRECNRDYDLGKPNKDADNDFIIKKGTKIIIPIHAIHRDPQYFPNPEKFDPERFSSENKDKMHSSAYIPFGIGPRNCIGLRLGLCEMKAITYQILLNMEILPTETTCIPAKLCPSSLSLKLEGGHTLRLRLRAHT
ncbi:unnamed protein product [Arctia plantaginis]|uniref:unspecific monooxygenase n=1 Tax=Arctia plantaginis TaxID=874455 RepID=A0A8S1B4M2_ARCPL|nr:unnamed protein product [Arctia plantaginis]